jgi:plasmid stability protein
MTETLTIRLPAAQRRNLRARAAAAGKTESEVVREMLDQHLQAKAPLRERAGRFIGQLDFDPAASTPDAWRSHLQRMNTRP